MFTQGAAALFHLYKSAYARLVTAPSGKSYTVSSGIYDDHKEG
jgi:hypothetical protein